ncbi:MAG: 2-hydroxychromene-2-carboxylate isomerase [Burkholderiaceae bacterium]
MTKEVEFFFDVGSPSSYLAATQLPTLCEAAGATLIYRPMLLGGVFQAVGNKSPMEVPAKGRYVFEDLLRHAQRYGVPLKHNPFFPINTLLLMRAATALQLKQPDRFLPYVDAVFRAIWIDQRDMNDASVVAAVVQRIGLDPASVMAAVTDPEVKAALKATTDEAVARGVFGAPTVFVGSQMFFGQDRLDFIRDVLART